MRQKPSIYTKIAILLVLLMSVMNIVLAWKYNYSVNDNSEFAAMQTAAVGLKSMVIIGLSVLSLFLTVGLFKTKKWVAISLTVLMLLLVAVLAVSNIETTAPEALIDISFAVKLLLPFLIIISLWIGRISEQAKMKNFVSR